MLELNILLWSDHLAAGDGQARCTRSIQLRHGVPTVVVRFTAGSFHGPRQTVHLTFRRRHTDPLSDPWPDPPPDCTNPRMLQAIFRAEADLDCLRPQIDRVAEFLQANRDLLVRFQRNPSIAALTRDLRARLHQVRHVGSAVDRRYTGRLDADCDQLTRELLAALKRGSGKRGKLDPKEVRREYDKLEDPPRERAAILAKRFGVTPRAIRDALKKSGSM